MEQAPTLSTPEEELAYLRAQLAAKEAELRVSRGDVPPTHEERTRMVKDRLEAYKKVPAERVLAPAYQMPTHEAESTAARILRELSFGNTEQAVAQLRDVMQERGIKNAFTVLEKSQDPHLVDDFHRYLARLIAAGEPIAGLNEKAPKFAALHMTLYEVALPEPEEEKGGREKTLKELVSAMEQLYAGLLSVADAVPGEPGYFVLELAIPANLAELGFYVAVPNGKRDLFEKQLLAIFPNARIAPQTNDYNAFADSGASVCAEARLAEHPALPLKDYSEFDYDPLNAIVNAFAKIEREGEGAALQIIVEPRGERHVKHYQKILAGLRKGQKRSEAFSAPETALGEAFRGVGKTLFSSKPKDEQKAKEAETRQIEENKTLIEQVEKKITAPIVGTTIRLLASAGNETRATQMLSELEASFNQFAGTQGNRMMFTRAAPRAREHVFEAFTFRLPGEATMPLSLRELTSLYHFPPRGIESSPHLTQSRFTEAPAPLSLPREGVLLGSNTFRGHETEVRLAPEDRLRHLYVIGQTGTGKSGCLQSLIIQDIMAGNGCCFIDPHGKDVFDILAAVPPERYEDVIYFDPADISRPFGLNMLEFDPARPEQKTFIVNELLAIFRQLYGDVPESMGPAFEQYFRNATQLIMEDPASGSTMLDIPRVLSDAEYRAHKLSKSSNLVVNQFWTKIASQAGGEASLENIVPYITNKFDEFTANDFMRPIIGQQESSFKFRDVIDHKKILLVNLSKGRLGERNANLLGLIIVGKLFMAALSRAGEPGTQFPPFYLYIDEFQNITTSSISGILSEARKYKLSLTMAHQFLAQIDEKIRGAIFGNVGNMAVFRVGEEDGEFFAKQFAPVFSALDFVNIENRNAYVRVLAGGVPQKPFNIRTPDLPFGNQEQVDDLIKLSTLTFGRDRATVEAMIRERYLS